MLTFPEPIEPQVCYLIAIDKAMVPIISGLFAKMCERRVWSTDEDYEQAYNTFTHLRGCMLTCQLSQLLERQDQLYRLLDRVYLGTEYSVTGIDPLVIVPPIPVIPENEALGPGLMWQADQARLKLQTIIEKLEDSGEFDADMLEQLVTIAGLLV